MGFHGVDLDVIFPMVPYFGVSFNQILEELPVRYLGAAGSPWSILCSLRTILGSGPAGLFSMMVYKNSQDHASLRIFPFLDLGRNLLESQNFLFELINASFLQFLVWALTENTNRAATAASAPADLIRNSNIEIWKKRSSSRQFRLINISIFFSSALKLNHKKKYSTFLNIWIPMVGAMPFFVYRLSCQTIPENIPRRTRSHSHEC